MKNIIKKLTLLTVPFLVMGCAGIGENSNNTSKADNSSEESQPTSEASSESSIPSSSSIHEHQWATEWSSDGTNHWHACSGCNEKKDNAAHTFGEWQTANLGELVEDARFNLSTVKYRDCNCGYRQIDDDQKVLPEIRFDFPATITEDDGTVTQQRTDFATAARSTDTSRPTVQGKVSITNAGKYNTEEGSELAATMKVRGNQTAGFDKKGFQIKFDKKQSMLGLNGGKKFKKWVLLADAKDSTISRTALGFSLSKGIIDKDSNVWSSDFTPVSVYLNGTYWGMYMLAEQKEVKDGRIKLDEPIEEVPDIDPETGEQKVDKNGNPKTKEQNIMTPDIGYCFEMDYYARNEASKGADGDPTFSISYGNLFTNSDYRIESPLANSGLGIVGTYTMNSDINDGPKDAHTDDTNSQQVAFIKKRLQALFNVLAQGAKNNAAYDINEETNTATRTTALNVRQTIEKNFDLNAWAEGFIINAVCLPPDVGYSSFYMSFDNTPNGDKKLRYDNPWDFDSNFGNRRGFITTADSQEGNFDPYFMNRTANMWFNLLNKFTWFINDYVKPKWQAAVQNKVFEGMVNMANTFYTYFEGEYKRNFVKWPTTQVTSDSNVSSYFNGDGERSGELRTPFVQVSDRKLAQKETINWLTKRVNYLNKKWGAAQQ